MHAGPYRRCDGTDGFKLGLILHYVTYSNTISYIHQKLTILSLLVQRVQEILCFFIIPCNISLAYISLEEIFKALRRVYSLSYWMVNFWTTDSNPVLARRREKLIEINLKKHNFPWTPCTINALFHNSSCYQMEFKI